MKYSEKKIIKAVTEIYERVLSPQEIKANELIEKFNTFMKEINDSIDLLNEDIEDFNNTYNLTYDNGGMKFLKHTSYNEWALKNISKLFGDWEIHNIKWKREQRIKNSVKEIISILENNKKITLETLLNKLEDSVEYVTDYTEEDEKAYKEYINSRGWGKHNEE